MPITLTLTLTLDIDATGEHAPSCSPGGQPASGCCAAEPRDDGHDSKPYDPTLEKATSLPPTVSDLAEAFRNDPLRKDASRCRLAAQLRDAFGVHLVDAASLVRDHGDDGQRALAHLLTAMTRRAA